MLGCQDFCGYYEWTFHYLRRKFGRSALEKFWREAIAVDSQAHYIAAGKERGLRGLYECWQHTGESEHCEWTVSLDEDRNHLRLDMRECPSKGFLLKNDLNADEDYCDHCVGWIGPALNVIGAQVVAHEHNHCGQCWWQIAMKGRDAKNCDLEADIRNVPSWQAGYLDRFENHQRVSADSARAYDDPSVIIEELFTNIQQIAVVGDEEMNLHDSNTGLIFTDRAYLREQHHAAVPTCVLLGYDSGTLAAVAEKWLLTDAAARPLLLHSYLPSRPHIAFPQFGLPRPLPYLPLLIRRGVYQHRPQEADLPLKTFGKLIATSLKKDVIF